MYFDRYVVILHRSSQRYYTLDRGYNLNEEDTKETYEKITSLKKVEYTHRFRQASVVAPDWVDGLDNEEFDTFWTR